jgi:hypothetical protein
MRNASDKGSLERRVIMPRRFSDRAFQPHNDFRFPQAFRMSIGCDKPLFDLSHMVMSTIRAFNDICARHIII